MSDKSVIFNKNRHFVLVEDKIQQDSSTKLCSAAPLGILQGTFKALAYLEKKDGIRYYTQIIFVVIIIKQSVN